MTLIGVIGGSKLCDLEDIQNKDWIEVDTVFGAPSDKILQGIIGSQKITFFPRHGRGLVFARQPYLTRPTLPL